MQPSSHYQQPSNVYSQHSKITSIIKKRTKDIDGDEDDDLGYSQSSQTHLGQQLDGLIQKQQQDQIDKMLENLNGNGGDIVDMNFFNDINNECNYLITKFQQDQYVSQRAQLDAKRRKGSDLNIIAAKNNKIISEEDTARSKLLQQDKSNKTVADMKSVSKANMIPPITMKNQLRMKNQQFISQEEISNQNNNKINYRFNSAAITHSNVSGRIKNTDYNSNVYENRSAHQYNGHNFQQENQPSLLEDKVSSIQVINNDKKMFEEGSNIQVSSHHMDNSKFSVSDQQSQIDFNSHNNNTLKVNEQVVSFRDQTKDKVTFREETHFQNNNPYDQNLPEKPSLGIGIGIGNAQFDLQNFNAFNERLPGGESLSLTASKQSQYQDNQNNFSQSYPKQQQSKEFHQQVVIQEQKTQNVQSPEVFQVKHKKEDNDDERDLIKTKAANQSARRYNYNLSQDDDCGISQEQQFNKGYQESEDNQQNQDDEEENYEDEEFQDDQDEEEQDQQQQQLYEYQQPTYQNLQQTNNQSRKLSPDKKLPDHINEDVIYNRLPKNFFVQEEEAKDMDIVLSSIQQMRQDFLGYISESNIQQKLDEISNIIQPEKFIQKHFGLEEDNQTQILFEKVLSPKKNLRKSPETKNTASIVYQDQREMYDEDDDEQEDKQIGDEEDFDVKFQINNAQELYDEMNKKGNVEEIQQKIKEGMHNAILEEDLEYSPDKNGQDSKNHNSQIQQDYGKGKFKKESTKQKMRIKSAKKIINPPDSTVLSATNTHRNQRVIKMADYFKKSDSNNNNNILPLQSPHMPQFLDNGKNLQNLRNNNQDGQDEDDNISLNEEEKDQLKHKMEQDILQNIDINFLFNKGENLRFALIDQVKVYKLMVKIKQVASHQVERGIKEIDYNQIVKYLKDEELYGVGDEPEDQNEDEATNQQQNNIQNQNPNSEPVQLKPPPPPKEPKVEKSITQAQWTQVVDFMRKNPKLLMQMLPDNFENDKEDEQSSNKSFTTNNNKNKNKLLQQIEEAKKWAKLQALSKNFLQKRDLLEALDNDQIFQLSSPHKSSTNKEKNKQKAIYKNKKELQSPKTNKDQNIDSDNDYLKNKQTKENQQQIYQKQFQYNSVQIAKNIYSNPPYTQQPVDPISFQTTNTNNKNNVGNESNQQQQQSQLQQIQQYYALASSTNNNNYVNRQVQSQQQARVKTTQNQRQKKASALSTTMGDGSTIGGTTTVTGNFTHMNIYNNNLQKIGFSQHQTIDQDKAYNLNDVGASILQNYSNQDKNIAMINNHNAHLRRPITASAAQSGNHQQPNRSLSYMRPILQARQESLDGNFSKATKFQRGLSLNRNQQAINYNGQYDSLNNSAMNNNYFSNNNNNQNFGQLEFSQNVNNLNQSFAGSSTGFNQILAPINLGPSKKAKRFIDKIAPNLKENDLYPKFINRVRRIQNNANNQANNINNNHSFNQQQRLQSNDSVHSSQRQIKMPKQKDSMATTVKNLNQSLGNIDNTEYEQTPQGIFPKFIKNQATLMSQASSRKDSILNNSGNQPITQNSSKKLVNQNMQTRIGGLNNKLLISPATGGVHDPFFHDGGSQLSRQDSQQSDKFSKKHVKIPIIDWAYTPLFQKALEKNVEFNRDQDLSLYLEKEVDYVIEMMKGKYKEFKRSDIMRPFYLKSQQTLQALLQEQGLYSVYESMNKKYKEITIENTMKLLIRCKLSFHARSMIIEILNTLITYEISAIQLKEIIDKHNQYKISQQDYDEIQINGKKTFDDGHQLLVKIQALKSVHKQFKNPFIFKKKDYVNYVKSEMSEVKKLLSVFRALKEGEQITNEAENEEELKQIEENRHETEEQSYYSATDNQNNTNEDDQFKR